MLRALALISALALAPTLAHADHKLAGGPIPNVTAHSTGACHMETSTETVHGVRIQRSRPVGCERRARVSERASTSVRPIEVTVNTRVNLAPRRRGTSRYVLGSPGYWRGTGTRDNYVLGAPVR